MITEDKIKEAAEKCYPLRLNTSIWGFTISHRAAFEKGAKWMQEQQAKVDLTALKEKYYKAACKGNLKNETDLIDIDAVWNHFLPYLQQPESDAVEFAKFCMENAGVYPKDKGKKYSINEDPLQPGWSYKDLYMTEFKQSKLNNNE